MDWLGLLAVQGTLKSLLQHHSSKESIPRRSAFFVVQLSHPYVTTGKAIALTMVLMKTGVDKDKQTPTNRTACCPQPKLFPKATCELLREASHGPCSFLASSSTTLPPSFSQAWLWNRSSSERSLCSYISSVTLPLLLMRTAWDWLLGFLFRGTSIPPSTLPFKSFCWGTRSVFSPKPSSLKPTMHFWLCLTSSSQCWVSSKIFETENLHLRQMPLCFTR